MPEPVTREPLCTVPWCPYPSSPDWHQCIRCGANAIEHAHVESRARAPHRKRDKTNIVALCQRHHQEVDLRQNGTHAHFLADLASSGLTYWVVDIHGNTIFERVLSRGDEQERSLAVAAPIVREQQLDGPAVVVPAEGLPIERPESDVEAPLQHVQAEGGALGRGGKDEILLGAPTARTQQVGERFPAPAEGFTTTQGAALTFDRWVEQGRSLGGAERDMPWAVGDWVIVGEEAFGEEHAQGLDALGLGLKAINNRAWVAKCFPPSARVAGVSWSHHRLLAKADYTDEERRHWLMRARDEDLTVRALRELIMGPPEPKRGRCPACGHEAPKADFNA